MQALEHAMLGGGLVLAAGLHRRFGWQLAASAAVCATLPDWDGLTVLLQSYDREYAGESCALPDVAFIGRVVRVEFSL